jgi:hypothetical protein
MSELGVQIRDYYEEIVVRVDPTVRPSARMPRRTYSPVVVFGAALVVVAILFGVGPLLARWVAVDSVVDEPDTTVTTMQSLLVPPTTSPVVPVPVVPVPDEIEPSVEAGPLDEAMPDLIGAPWPAVEAVWILPGSHEVEFSQIAVEQGAGGKIVSTKPGPGGVRIRSLVEPGTKSRRGSR